MKIPNLFWLFSLMLWIPVKTQALEIEDRLPPNVWQLETRWSLVPDYEQAFNHQHDPISLKDFLIRDREIRERIQGEIERRENVMELDWEYGWNTEWMVGITLPYFQRYQRSSLALIDAAAETDGLLASRAATVIQNLSEDQELRGLGDISLKTGFELDYNDSLFVRGGGILRIPTGDTGTARGIHSNAIGEHQTDLTGFLHFTRYPLHGVRNGIRISATGQIMEGERETLEGEKGAYLGGNVLDFQYNWVYELNNSYAGVEFQRLQGTESHIAGQGQNNPFSLFQFQVEIGFGNLSDLENSPLDLPYQIRFNWTVPYMGQHVPINPRGQVTWLIFF